MTFREDFWDSGFADAVTRGENSKRMAGNIDYEAGKRAGLRSKVKNVDLGEAKSAWLFFRDWR